MHRIQNLFSRRFDQRHGRTGSIRQNRYKVKYVENESYLGRLVLYVHLNPVTGGVADDPDEYVFCGHREIKRRLRNAFVDADETLPCFGSGKKEARRAYLRAIRGGAGRDEKPDRLVWHPFDSGGEDQPLKIDRTSPKVDFLGRSTDRERPTLDPMVFVKTVCDLLDIDMAVVCSRARDRHTAAARKMMVTLGVERWRQSRTGLARVLQKNPHVVSWWAGEGAKIRINDPEYAAELDRLDQGVAARAAEMTASERVGRTF